MRTLQNFPEFQKPFEKLQALENEHRQGEERKAAIQDEANRTSPSARVAFDASWRQEYQQVERRAPLLREEIEAAKQELSRVRGQVSLHICQEFRPHFAEQTKIVLRALKQLSDANDKLTRMRSELETQGVETGSIPNSNFAVGAWSDPYGGGVSSYQQWIRENFPELKHDTY